MVARGVTWDKVRRASEELYLRGASVTVKGVAKLAGVSRATIYNDPALLRFVGGYELEQEFDKGYETATEAGSSSGRDRTVDSAMYEWARGILYIEPGEPITPDLLRRKRAQLSHFLHPDKGGDTSLQQTLNRAFDILKGKSP